ncbi:SbcC/MukB-like Walker B domain-containing protein [Enterococcus hermanniensis]|uniref:Nuclease SbcCD subunit C n=1 Tax=Enterococcus hermanniensis TaxID=249189 RepID=A0A1L8TPI2_9ENTE|nr:SMC family ATPase [Enterococcus hermanniensis]OJG45984.1 exonuclease SbcC [Enterococcus hermanniensis]
MLPKKIIMENFGPFLHEEVDFEKMSETPLFLISGKTGAGKTTIFDAITFSLYGDASGGVRSSNEIRSSFAEPTEETRVQFIFEHQGRQYSIERWPKQTLAKKNGKGETTKNQKVQLSVFNDLGQEAEAYTKVDAVNEVIYQILHLQKEQFRQIVMLPQGEFRTFLNANSTEKEAVLRNLFGTSAYRSFTENLKFKKIAMEKSVGELTTRMDQLFQQVLCEQGDTYQESLNLANYYLSTEAQELLQSQTELETQQKNYKMLQQQVHEAQELTGWLQQKDETIQELAQLEMEQPIQEQRKQQLKQAQTLEQIRPIYERRQELERLLKQRQTEITDNKIQLKTLDQQLVEAQQQTLAFEKEAGLWQVKRQNLQKMEAALPLVKQQAELKQQANDLEAKQTVQQAQLLELNQQLASFEQEQKILQAKQNDEKNWQNRRYQELHFQQQLNQLKDAAKKITAQQEAEEEQQIDLAQLIEKKSQLSNQLMTITGDYKKLKSQWAAAEIARLSLELLPGEPCPVCGSKEHPDPASHEGMITDNLAELQSELEQLEARIKQLELLRGQQMTRYEVAKQTFEKAQADRVTAQKDLNKKVTDCHKQLIDYYQTTLPLELDQLVTSLAEKQIETDQKLKEITIANQQMALLAEKMTSRSEAKRVLETILDEVKSEQQLLRGRISSIEEQTTDWQLTELEQQIKEFIQAIKEHEESVESQQALIKSLEQHQIRLQEQQQALTRQVQETTQNMSKQRCLLKEKLTEASITEEQLMLEKIDLETLESAIANFDNHQGILKDRLQRLIEQIADRAKPELEVLQAALVERETQVSQLQQQYYARESQLQQQRVIIKTITELHNQSKKQLDELGQMVQLYQTMNGDNPQKISLERYVLQWYLAEVLQSANQQLNQLTKGRYHFELKQETGRSKGNTGLEINVYDDNAGATRSSHTLSGGESFIAALSLALGLAEVIQSQAGGVDIEALFIDEGFGSLDEEALEMAMEALEGIENAGRMIGIISHVRELKERIPQQIIVETSGTGRSSIRYQLEGWSEA